MTPYLSHIANTIGMGAAMGGAGTVNRAAVDTVGDVVGAESDGFGRKVAEFAVPAAIIGVAIAANPVTVIGGTVARVALVGGSMALLESSAGVVKKTLGLVGLGSDK